MSILQSIKNTLKNLSCINEKSVDVVSPQLIPQQLQERSPHIIQMRGVYLHHK